MLFEKPSMDLVETMLAFYVNQAWIDCIVPFLRQRKRKCNGYFLSSIFFNLVFFLAVHPLHPQPQPWDSGLAKER